MADAVSWYVDNGRVQTRPERETALEAMVEAWATDALAGHEAVMYAWRKANVEQLNRLVREGWRAAGRLLGPDVVAPGAPGYAVGDWVVTLAPERGKLVTNERGVVVSAKPNELAVRMQDRRVVHLAGEKFSADRLAHGYATTVHRAQGATVDVAHCFEDGGGRELVYVAMSRSRERATSWVVADDVAQAAEDLVREWSVERRPRWAIDRGTPTIKISAADHKHRATPKPDAPEAERALRPSAKRCWPRSRPIRRQRSPTPSFVSRKSRRRARISRSVEGSGATQSSAPRRAGSSTSAAPFTRPRSSPRCPEAGHGAPGGAERATSPARNPRPKPSSRKWPLHSERAWRPNARG